MWTKLPPPDYESVDNQIDMYSLVSTHPHLGGRVLTWGRRDLEAADKIAVYRVKVFLFELF
jgi:hypothetical protein